MTFGATNHRHTLFYSQGQQSRLRGQARLRYPEWHPDDRWYRKRILTKINDSLWRTRRRWAATSGQYACYLLHELPAKKSRKRKASHTYANRRVSSPQKLNFRSNLAQRQLQCAHRLRRQRKHRVWSLKRTNSTKTRQSSWIINKNSRLAWKRFQCRPHRRKRR